jgi:hypothetical protein
MAAPVYKTESIGRGDSLRWPRDTLYPLKLALPSPKSGGRSVGIVRRRTKSRSFFVATFRRNLSMKLRGTTPQKTIILTFNTLRTANVASWVCVFFFSRWSIRLWRVHDIARCTGAATRVHGSQKWLLTLRGIEENVRCRCESGQLETEIIRKNKKVTVV